MPKYWSETRRSPSDGSFHGSQPFRHMYYVQAIDYSKYPYGTKCDPVSASVPTHTSVAYSYVYRNGWKHARGETRLPKPYQRYEYSGRTFMLNASCTFWPPGSRACGPAFSGNVGAAITQASGRTIPDVPGHVRQRALSSVMGRIPRASFDAGMFLVELRETTGLLAQGYARLAKSARFLKRRQFLNAARVVGYDIKPGRLRKLSVGEKYLEVFFGWRLLVGDLQDMIGDLERVRDKFSPEFFVSDYSVETQKSVFNVTSVQVAGAAVTGQIAFEEQLTFRSDIGFRIRIHNPELVLANSFGLTDPFSLAWNAGKFTFLVDWAVNVGDWIKQFSIMQGMGVVAGWEKCVTTRYTRPLPGPVTLTGDWGRRVVFGTMSGSETAMKFQRYIHNQLPYLELRFDPNYNLAKLGASIALLDTAVKGLPRRYQ